MTTLIEAAQGIVDSANRLGTTSTMMLPYYLIEALEQAIAQEQKQHSQFGSPDRQALIIANLDPQPASTKPVVSQKTSGAVDKDCGNCKKFSTNSLTGGPVCISCKDYSNWEPKP